jgi:epsilon-lactone hydrolase
MAARAGLARTGRSGFGNANVGRHQDWRQLRYEKVDNILVSRHGFCDAATVIYAHGHDLKDPLISPVYGDMHGFPPTILTIGARDLLLSNTVRVHRKLRRAGIGATLQVYEGESHAQYEFDDTLPESKEAFGEIASFFGAHLRK